MFHLNGTFISISNIPNFALGKTTVSVSGESDIFSN